MMQLLQQARSLSSMSSPQALSFVALVVQNVCLVLLVRASRVRPRDQSYDPATLVLVTELAKLVLNASLECLLSASGASTLAPPKLPARALASRPTPTSTPPSTRTGKSAACLSQLDAKDLLRMSLPALLYVIQNNLLYVALTNLSVPLYQVTNQGKIAATALFGYWFLGRSLGPRRVVALGILGCGIALAQLAESETSAKSGGAGAEGGQRDHDYDSLSTTISSTSSSASSHDHDENRRQLVGLLAMAISSITSGVAGVYFEWMLKKNRGDSDSALTSTKPAKSVYFRNVELALPSIFFAMISLLKRRFYTQTQRESGFFAVYDGLVWLLVAVQAFGGLLVALVMKHADSNVKVLAVSLSVILASVLSALFLGEAPSGGLRFWTGAFMVLLSCLLYYNSPAPSGKMQASGVGARPSSFTFFRLVAIAFIIHNVVALEKVMGRLHSMEYIFSQTSEQGNISASADSKLPLCTKESAVYPKHDTISTKKQNNVLQSEEVLSYIVSKLAEMGAPTTPMYGNLLREFRNGTGPCLHAQPEDKDFDLAVLSQHFELVAGMANEIRDKFGWKMLMDPILKQAYKRKFLTFSPSVPSGKKDESFQVDIYGFQCNLSSGLVSSPWDLISVEISAFLPLRPYKPVLTPDGNSLYNGTRNSRFLNPAFYHMPYNPPCLLENLYGADYMTPKGVSKKTQAKWGNEHGRPTHGNPRCNATLTLEEEHELERQLAFCSK